MSVKVTWRGDEAKSKVIRGAPRALRAGGEYLLEAANRTVPIEEDTLEKSGKVSVSGLQATVSYDTPYARRQHEDLTLRHSSGRRAKWLQRTLDERARAINDVIGSVLRGAF